MKYRLYIDEVGNHDLNIAQKDPNQRYLSLTGIAINLAYVQSTLQPELESLKSRYFNSHPDDPIIFHRRELSQAKYPFQALKDEDLKSGFDEELLIFLERWEYTVFSVVLDKLEHQNKYTVWRYDPYHYCMHVLLERYVKWMQRQCDKGEECFGDVMAEARGGKEDMRLKKSFEGVCQNGTDFEPASTFTARLTSQQLKVKPKSNNIAGLQLADLIAHPSSRAIRFQQSSQAIPDDFGKKVYEILSKKKYDRSPSGKISGWGTKWLP